MNSQHGSRSGPIERRRWPDRLDAFVLEPGSRPRLHGYDLHGDLASNYRFGELVLTALRGAPPDPTEGRAFEIALAFASGISIAEAPVHAAALANLMGAPPTSVLAAGTVALTEQVRELVDQHTRLLDALLATDSPPSPAHRTDSLSPEDSPDLAASGLDREASAPASADHPARASAPIDRVASTTVSADPRHGLAHSARTDEVDASASVSPDPSDGFARSRSAAETSAYVSPEDSEAVERLRAAIAEIGLHVPGLQRVTAVPTGILAVLRACGLSRAWQLVSAIVIARIAPMMAEATRHRAGHFTGYPIDLPRFRYAPADGEPTEDPSSSVVPPHPSSSPPSQSADGSTPPPSTSDPSTSTSEPTP